MRFLMHRLGLTTSFVIEEVCMSWRNYRVGDNLRYFGEEFDGKWDLPCTVTDVFNDHAIADYEGTKLWIDDMSAHMFRLA